MSEEPASKDEEMSLIELWGVLWRRKWWFCFPFLLVALSGTIYLLARSPIYMYAGILQVGHSFANRESVTQIESSSSAASSSIGVIVKNITIPEVLGRYLNEHPNTKSQLKNIRIHVDVNRYSNIVVLKSLGTRRQGQLIMHLLRKILTAAATQENTPFHEMRKNLRMRIQLLNELLKEIADQKKLVQHRLDQLHSTMRTDTSSAKPKYSAAPPSQQAYTLRRKLISFNQETQLLYQELADSQTRLLRFAPARIAVEPPAMPYKAGVSGQDIALITFILSVLAGLLAAYGAEFMATEQCRRHG